VNKGSVRSLNVSVTPGATWRWLEDHKRRSITTTTFMMRFSVEPFSALPKPGVLRP
jgi:hypothetical protein